MNHSFFKKSLLGLMIMSLLSLNFINPSTASDDVLGVANPLLEVVSLHIGNVSPPKVSYTTPLIGMAFTRNVWVVGTKAKLLTESSSLDMISCLNPIDLGMSKLD